MADWQGRSSHGENGHRNVGGENLSFTFKPGMGRTQESYSAKKSIKNFLHNTNPAV